MKEISGFLIVLVTLSFFLSCKQTVEQEEEEIGNNEMLSDSLINKTISDFNLNIQASGIQEESDPYIQKSKIARFYKNWTFAIKNSPSFDLVFDPEKCPHLIYLLDVDKSRLKLLKTELSSGKLPNNRVDFDYVGKQFIVDRKLILNYLNKIKSQDENGYILLKFGIDEDVLGNDTTYSNFCMTFTGLDSNFVRFNGIKDFPINNTACDNSKTKNLKKLYSKLHNSGIKEFNPDYNKDGVVFKISNSLKWVGSDSSSNYYLYPAFNGSYTTGFISSNTNLWNFDCSSSINAQRSSSKPFGGNEGQSCCPI